MKKRFWVSWECTANDYRPLSFPPNEAICGWWCSGYSADDNAILCAVVDAENEGGVMKAVYADWPEAENYVREFDWRFFKPQDTNWKPGDRFPASEWMLERL